MDVRLMCADEYESTIAVIAVIAGRAAAIRDRI